MKFNSEVTRQRETCNPYPALKQSVKAICLSALGLLFAATGNAQQPSVSVLSTGNGHAGSSLVITGTNFNTTPSNNIVFFGATQASVNSASATSLDVTVPLGATYMPVSVNNTASALTAYSQYPFLQTFDTGSFVSGVANFVSALNFSTGTFPNAVSTGDLDGDGKVDIVGSNFNGSSIYIRRNTSVPGAISFANAITLATGANPFKLKVGDIDGDGKPDIAIPCRSAGVITLYRNTSTVGNISFAAAETISVSDAPGSIAICDIDADGKPDLVTSRQSSHNISIFRNLGSVGTFSFAPGVNFPALNIPYQVTTGDIDGDGMPDISIAHSGSVNSISIFRNTSSPGTVSLAPRIDIATGTKPYFSSLADIDGDGKADLLNTNFEDATMSVFRSTSTPGTISFEPSVTFNTSNRPQELTIGDFNGDGKPDVAVSNNISSNISVFRNNGTVGSISFSRVNYSAQIGPAGINAADFDGDGKADIAVTNQSSNSFSVFRNNPLRPTTGTLRVCLGNNTTLTNTTGGGTWSSSNTSIATVTSATGIVRGIAAGVADITYTVTGGRTFVQITVDPLPVISGATSICVGSTTALSGNTGGGTWFSGNLAAVSIGLNNGSMAGLAPGISNIVYTLASGCASNVTVTVNTPTANVGTPIICLGQPHSVAILSNPEPGGTWSCSNAGRVLISPATGIAKGVKTGTAVISYNYGADCHSATTVTVNGAVSPITGVTNICPGATTSLTNLTPGGAWSSSNSAIASTGTGSIITGAGQGTTTITYMISAGCYKTTNILVYSGMSDIAGTATLCQGSATDLFSSPAGGGWSSNAPWVASVTPTGQVNGMNAGTAVITYLLGSAGCYVTKTVTVNPPVAVITGNESICPGLTANLLSADGGGTWSSNNEAKATVDAASGVVTGISSGTAVISYVISPTCYSTAIQTVHPAPSPIAGNASVCEGFTSSLTSSSGGTWSSSNTAAATISMAGAVRGIAEGVTTITYRISNTSCIATQEVTVNSIPSDITGSLDVCIGSTTELTCTTDGGEWSSSNQVKASVDAVSGLVTGLTQGTSIITYMLPSGCYQKVTIPVNPQPAAITGAMSVEQGAHTILGSATGGGIWSSMAPATASFNPSTGGRIFGASAGTTVVTYMFANTGCYQTRSISVVAARPAIIEPNGPSAIISVYPNPSTGTLSIEVPVAGSFFLHTIDGKLIDHYQFAKGVTTISLPLELAAGIYMCRFVGDDGSSKSVRLAYQNYQN